MCCLTGAKLKVSRGHPEQMVHTKDICTQQDCKLSTETHTMSDIKDFLQGLLECNLYMLLYSSYKTNGA